MGSEDETSYIIPGGMEYYIQEARGDVKKFARACIDAGADIVIGHSPHVLRETEFYKNRIIFYSLGNFIFTHPKFTEVKNLPSVSLQIEVKGNGEFIEARFDNFVLDKGIPVKDKNETGFMIIKKLSKSRGLIFKKNKILPENQ